MSDLSFTCGQVRALESKLLDVNRLDRMIGATSPEEAFRVLVELQYSEYFDDSTSVKDFARIIEQGLQETKQLLINGTQNHLGLSMLWQKFDLNNLKRGLKIKHKENAEKFGSFSEENGFSTRGELGSTELEAIIFENRFPDNLATEYQTVLSNTETILQNHEGAFRYVEFALDLAYFEIAQRITTTTKCNFLKEVYLFGIDSTNYRNLARSILIGEEKLPPEAWVDGGCFFYDDIEKIEEFLVLKKYALTARFGDYIQALEENTEPEINMLQIEQTINKAYFDLLNNSVLGEVTGISIPYVYFEKRLQNARMIKFVMYAKFHGLSPQKILETLKHF